MRCATRQCQMNAVARVLRASASEEVRLVLRASCFGLRASGFSGHCTLYTVHCQTLYTAHRTRGARRGAGAGAGRRQGRRARF
jgi:hypothetical protein